MFELWRILLDYSIAFLASSHCKMYSLPELSLTIVETLLFGFLWYGSLRLLYEVVFHSIVRQYTRVDGTVIILARALAMLFNVMLLFQLLREYRSAPAAEESGRLTWCRLFLKKHFRHFLLPSSMGQLYAKATHSMALPSTGNSSHFTWRRRVGVWQCFRFEMDSLEYKTRLTFRRLFNWRLHKCEYR